MNKEIQQILLNQSTIMVALAQSHVDVETLEYLRERVKECKELLSPTKQDKAYKNSLKEEKG